MIVIHDTVSISSAHQPPSLGALSGSRVSNEVFESINSGAHRSFFGDDFRHMSQEFFQRYVAPMDQISFDISRTVNAVLNPDRIRILNTMDDFKSIPLSMEIPILLFEPVRKAALEGRVSGFGYDPEWLPEDMYGRLIDNFTCEDVLTAKDEDGYYPIQATMFSDDEVLSDDKLYAISETRDYIRNHILKKTDRDPTDIDVCRG